MACKVWSLREIEFGRYMWSVKGHLMLVGINQNQYGQHHTTVLTQLQSFGTARMLEPQLHCKYLM